MRARVLELSGHDDHHDAYEVAILAPIILLGLGALLRHSTRNWPIPYTMQLLLVGTALGVLLRLDGWQDALQQSVVRLGDMDPHLMLHIFLPPLIFESAASLEWHLFDKNKWFIFALAGPGMVIASALTGIVVNLLLQYTEVESCAWPSQAGLLLGVILSATDPVAVVALLKDLGCKASLATAIEGESLFNDGTALVVFTILTKLVEGDNSDSWEDYLWTFVKMSFGGAIFGAGFGVVIVRWLGLIFNDALAEITITVSAAYLCFFVAEYFLHVSGVIAVVCLGLYFGHLGKVSVSPEVAIFLAEFWEMLAFFGNTLIFVVAGTVIGYKLPRVPVGSVGILALIYVVCTLVRAVVVGMVFGIFRCFNVEQKKSDQVVIVWGGLRGAVSLSLALMVFGNQNICGRVRDEIMFHTAGIVVLTVCVNASTMPKLVAFLGINAVSTSKQLMHDQAMQSLCRAGEKQESHIRADHPGAIFEEARKYYYRVPTKKASPAVGDATKQTFPEAKEVRRRVLMIAKKSYWRQFQDGLLSNHSVTYLIHHTNVALDNDCNLDEWGTFKKLLKFNSTVARETNTDVYSPQMSPSERRRLQTLRILDSVPSIAFILVLVIASCIVSFTVDDETTLGYLIFEHATSALFFVELLIRLYCVGDWHSFIVDPYTITDTVVVLMDIVLLGMGNFLGAFSGYTKSFRIIRFLRLIRIVRIARLAKTLRKNLRRSKISAMNEATALWNQAKEETLTKKYTRRVLFSQLRHGFEIATGFKVARQETLVSLADIMFYPGHQYSEIRSGIEKDLKDVTSTLLDMERLYSEIAASITTVIAARSVLNGQLQALYQLCRDGLLDQSEVTSIKGSIEFQMKRLAHRPPISKMPQKEEILRQIPWLECLSSNDLTSITESFTEAVFQRGDVLVEQDEVDDSVHVLARGTVMVSLKRKSGHQHEIDELGMGSVFGEIAWALRSKRGASIIATSPGLLFTISGPKLRELAKDNHGLHERLWRTCGMRLSENVLSIHLEDRDISRRQVRELVQEMKLYSVDPLNKSKYFNTFGLIVLLKGTAVQTNPFNDEHPQVILAPQVIESIESKGVFAVEFSSDAKYMCNPRTISSTLSGKPTRSTQLEKLAVEHTVVNYWSQSDDASSTRTPSPQKDAGSCENAADSAV